MKKERKIGILNSGRRKSDRWFTYLLITLLILESIFVFYTFVQQARTAGDLQRQDRVLVCYADKTEAFEQAMARYLVLDQQQPRDDGALQDALGALRKAQEDKQACLTEATR